MGQSTNQQTVPGVRIDLANVRGTTKFSDLTPELQKEIETCDDVIRTFKGHADQIAQFRAGHKGDLERLTHDVSWLQRKFDGVKTTLEDDVKVVANMKDLIKSDADIAKAAFKGAEQLKLPAHYHTTWLTASKPAKKKTRNATRATRTSRTASRSFPRRPSASTRCTGSRCRRSGRWSSTCPASRTACTSACAR